MTVPTEELDEQVRAVMDAHWQSEGYTVPNGATYPFQWLWDSCFHAVIWAELGDADRALTELAHVFRLQEPNGFVPHVDYQRAPAHHASFWGRAGASTVTQPPIHAHAVVELRRRGIDVPDELAERSAAHLAWFLRERRHPTGLVRVVHSWETGCDDSARFDHWGARDPARWYDVKGALVRDGGAGFDCAPVSLSAIVAWSCRLLALDDDGVGEAVAARWDRQARTWVDGGAAEVTSGRARTLEGLLPLLVDPRPEPLADLADPGAYAGRFGPRGAHRDDPTYEPGRYWRGSTWPQLAYLLWVAGATSLAEPTVRGAIASGLAEHWNPDTGEGLGAVPQSWTGLALLMR